MLWMYQRVFFGKVTAEPNRSLPDLDMRERLTLWPTALAAVAMGVAPLLWINDIDPAVHNALAAVAQVSAQVLGR